MKIVFLTDAELKSELALYEAKHGMSTAEFAERYFRGELGHNLDYIRWIGLYRMATK